MMWCPPVHIRVPNQIWVEAEGGQKLEGGQIEVFIARLAESINCYFAILHLYTELALTLVG